MSEMELTADRLVVIGRSKLLADTAMRDLIATNSQAHTLVRCPEPEELGGLLEAKVAQFPF